MAIHKPVLLEEALGFLQIKPQGRYLDATVGEGGHAAEIIKRGGLVLGVDQDSEMLKEAKRHLGSKAILAQGNFRNIDKIAKDYGFTNVDGIIFDLGMSTWQLQKSGRGFSFQRDEPLDMRMDPSLAVTAADLLNGLTRNELAKLFAKFGEEERAFQLASLIVRARTLRPFATTFDLKRAVEKVIKRKGHIHPATRVFQALRIAVNDELENLRSALPRAFEILKPGGRLVVISFHSLEDREVKEFFERLGKRHLGKIITDKPVLPTAREVAGNPRSRSAKLRCIER